MRWLKILGAIAALLVVSLVAACFVFGHRLPKSSPGEAAQQLAARVETAVNLTAWYQIPVITWEFRGSNVHLWDKHRGLAKISIPKDKTEVLLHIGSQKGIAFRDGKRLSGDEELKAVKKGYSDWANDSFWLNPLVTLRDKGVTLSVADDDPNALIVAFSSGGVTPGDTYRFHIGPDGKPESCDMWVSILPIKGANVSWKDWLQVDGAWVGGKHRFSFGVKIEISDVKSAKTAAELNNGVDPFAPLFAAEGTAPTSAPASAPANAPVEMQSDSSPSNP